jgi:hypothetical protein
MPSFLMSDNPGKPYGTPDAFIAVCGDDLQGIRRRRKKRENEDRDKDKDKDRFTGSDSQAKPKTKSQGVNVTGRGAKEDAHQVEGEGETECTNILYRVHTGVTLVSEQEISLDLSEPDQDHDQGSEKDTSDAVTVTEQSKLFSFSFCPATPPPSSEGENGEPDHTAPFHTKVIHPTQLHLCSITSTRLRLLVIHRKVNRTTYLSYIFELLFVFMHSCSQRFAHSSYLISRSCRTSSSSSCTDLLQGG